MKKIKLQMSRKQLIWGITALVSLIIGLILAGLPFFSKITKKFGHSRILCPNDSLHFIPAQRRRYTADSISLFERSTFREFRVQ